MIKVINDWYITVEDSPINYTVRRGEGKRDKKGKWLDRPRGYFGSLRKAVEEVRKQIIAEKFSEFPEGFTTLAEATRTIVEVDKQFEEILKKINA